MKRSVLGAGLFGTVTTGTIRNLGIVDSSMEIITPFAGTVSNYGNGMMVGRLQTNSLMEDCFNAGNIIYV